MTRRRTSRDRSIQRRPCTGNVRQRRQWLVLVVSQARLFTCRFASRPICYELCSISPRGKFAGADLSLAQVIFLSGSCFGGWRTANLEMLCHHQAISHNRRGARKHSLRGKCPVIQGTRVDRRECRELNILAFFLGFSRQRLPEK